MSNGQYTLSSQRFAMIHEEWKSPYLFQALVICSMSKLWSQIGFAVYAQQFKNQFKTISKRLIHTWIDFEMLCRIHFN